MLRPLSAGGRIKQSLGTARMSSATDAEDMTPLKPEDVIHRRGRKPGYKTNKPEF